MKKITKTLGLATCAVAFLTACETTASDPLTAPVAAQEAQDIKPEVVPIDPRTIVSRFDRRSKTPDHVSEPVGPMAEVHAYAGSLEPRKMYLIEASPEKGFQWPYFLFLPDTIPSGSSVLVQPNNDGMIGAPFETHLYWAGIENEQLFLDFGRLLGTPVLMPVFPRPLIEGPDRNLYIHALTRAAMTADDPRYARPDLQLIAMLDDALDKISRENHDLREGALFWGFSASGDFVTRMATLHPGRVRAVAAGGVGGLPILPVEGLENAQLTFPVGVGDLEEIGARFQPALLKQTPYLLFQGSIDENDSVKEPPFTCEGFGSDSYSCDQSLLVNSVFGSSPPGRVQRVASVFEAFGMRDFNYLILPGIEHTTPDTMEAVIREFYACVLADRTGCAKAAKYSR